MRELAETDKADNHKGYRKGIYSPASYVTYLHIAMT